MADASSALSLVVPVIGPPAAGKTTLTVTMGQLPDRAVFRLRDHVSEAVLAATASDADRLGWIDDVIVASALTRYVERLASGGTVRLVLLDNFPGSASQVGMLLSAVRKVVPGCCVRAVELLGAPQTLHRRAVQRRVCHRCERDPIRDPRLPAIASANDPNCCATCGGILHPRRGDAPRLLRARVRRYQQTAPAIRAAFAAADVPVTTLTSTDNPSATARLMAHLLDEWSVPR